MSTPSRSRIVLVVLLLASAVSGQKEVDRVVAKSATGKRLLELVERIPSVGFSGSVLAARDGKVEIACGVRFADLADREPNTATTLHEIASASKQFTAAAILALAEKKKLSLDDSIAKHLPGVPDSCEKITVRQLIQHTSGIPDDRGCHGDDLGRAVKTLLDGGPTGSPGEFVYWNYGYALLAGIIERRADRDFGEYCHDRLFKKARMKTACFTGDAAPRKSTVAIGRSKSDRGSRSALAHPYGAFDFVYKGMGGAVCSVWDLWRWDRALRGEKVLSAKSKDELFRPGPSEYALGWYVRKPRGRLMHQHGGAVRGFRADVRRYPDDDGSLFILSNRDDTEIHYIPELFESALFDEKFVLPPLPLSAELVGKLGGTYSGERMTMTLTREDFFVRATLKTGRGEGAPEIRGFIGADDEKKGKLVFYSWHEATPCRVAIDVAGTVASLTIRNETLRVTE